MIKRAKWVVLLILPNFCSFFIKLRVRGVLEKHVKSLEILTRRPTLLVLAYFDEPSIQKPVFYPISLVAPMHDETSRHWTPKVLLLLLLFATATRIISWNLGSKSFCFMTPNIEFDFVALYKSMQSFLSTRVSAKRFSNRVLTPGNNQNSYLNVLQQKVEFS